MARRTSAAPRASRSRRKEPAEQVEAGEPWNFNPNLVCSEPYSEGLMKILEQARQYGLELKARQAAEQAESV